MGGLFSSTAFWDDFDGRENVRGSVIWVVSAFVRECQQQFQLTGCNGIE